MSAKSETGLGILFSDLALRVSYLELKSPIVRFFRFQQRLSIRKLSEIFLNMTDWILRKGDANQRGESTDTWTVSRAYLQDYDHVALLTVKAQERYTYES